MNILRYLWALFLSLPLSLPAQLTLPDGVEFVLDGPVNLVLEDLDYLQEGEFTAGQSEVIFRGANSHFSPGLLRTPTFYRLTLDKAAGNRLRLQEAGIVVSDELRFTEGGLDLNGQQVDLQATGSLVNERDDSRAFNSGPQGGRIRAGQVLNAPAQADPGNLGLLISSAANLGPTQVLRFHDPQTVGATTGISRYYQILPNNNTGLNATLRFTYFDGELNGAAENDLEAFLSTDDGLNYSPQGFANRDATANFLEVSGVNQIPTPNRFTLAPFNATAFPVEWLDFTATPVDGRVLCQWHTGSEFNSDRFVVERSENGVAFRGVASLPAAGTSQEILAYEAWDNQPFTGRSWYRVQQVDLDGSVSYSPVVEVFFAPELQASLAPNPADHQTWIRLQTVAEGDVQVRVLDAHGRVVLSQRRALQAGATQWPLPVDRFAEGIYTVLVQQQQRQLRLPLVLR